MKPLENGDPRRLGQFEISERIGVGGMGVVFLGRSPSGRRAAVKVVRSELADDQEFRARFRREIDAARQVSGAYTAAVLGADPDGPRPWLATAFIEGPSLLTRVRRDGPLRVSEVRVLGAGLAEAMAELHRVGLVHRDVKPGNVLLAADGPRLIDFGIIRSDALAELTESGTVLGSVGFMAPEQAEGEAVGPAADVFAVGAVLTFAALGRGPFGTGSAATLLLRTVNEEPDLDALPEEIRAVIARCLAKDPTARPSVPELLDLLATRRDEPAAATAGGPKFVPKPALPIDEDGNDVLVPEPEGELERTSTPRPAPVPAPAPAAEAPAIPRRRAIIGAVATLIGLTSVGVGAAVISHGDAEQASSKPYTPTTPGPLPEPPKPTGAPFRPPLWSTAANTFEYGQLAVAGGVLYVGSSETGLVALDAATGTRKWSSKEPADSYVSLRDKEMSAPVSAGPTLYSVVAGTLVASSAQDGTILWATDPPPGTGTYVDSDVLGVVGSAIVCRQTYHSDITGGDGGTIWAVDTKTRAILWTVDGSEGTEALIAQPGLVVVTDTAMGAVTAYKAATGAPVWQTPAASSAPVSTLVSARIPRGALATSPTQVFQAGGRLRSLGTSTGTAGWTAAPPAGAVFRTVAAAGGLVYGIAVPSSQTDQVVTTVAIVALRETDGSFVWTQTGVPGNPSPGSILVAGGILYTKDGNNTTLSAIDAATGRTLWYWQDPQPPTYTLSAPNIVADAERVYATTPQGVAAFPIR